MNGGSSRRKELTMYASSLAFAESGLVAITTVVNPNCFGCFQLGIIAIYATRACVGDLYSSPVNLSKFIGILPWTLRRLQLVNRAGHYSCIQTSQ